ncbi:MAG: YfhO family protein [Isosphaeraceae bacterium]|nr:YfhO family protein [Isosphaeraceae bacterium]
MSAPSKQREPVWVPDPQPWGRGDLLAILAWTVALVVVFWNAVTLRGAFFFFDVSEINYPYRAFFARELCAGRFSRWCPDLYCGLPLYSESQAGYLHPLKYLLYPWLAAWKAFNLDTVLSVWLTGLGTYGWLRRHVGSAGALTGAAVFGLGGFVWAHLIHTSMINALLSVPLAVWALESAWETGRLRSAALGALALACQVFAGHLQDTILTAGLLGAYGLYRGLTERRASARLGAFGMAVGLIVLGIGLSAVQWVPSKKLLDRSPRAGGMAWEDVTYGSWSPELLPALVVREAYGTRARDTDWMDGFFPYHEMNAYMGLIALALAVVGGAAVRDRWVAFWVVVVGVGGVLMLGRYTFLFDVLHRIPVVGSSRIPVRFHLWVSLAVAALAAVGVDRLARPGLVSLRRAERFVIVLLACAVPILAFVYMPAWTERGRWKSAYNLAQFTWLGRELVWGVSRTAVTSALAWAAARSAVSTARPRRRLCLAACLPALLLVDLVGAHWYDAPTVAPAYWAVPPASARLVQSDPLYDRLYGICDFSSGEPGYVERQIDYMAVRDALDWSLPAAWNLRSARGETPIISSRISTYSSHTKIGIGRFDIEGVTHVIVGNRAKHRFEPVYGRGLNVGSATVFRNLRALARARLMGRPVYVADQEAAGAALEELGPLARERLVVEDPDRPLAETTEVQGNARITRDEPEHVAVETDAEGAAYLVLADTFDPGWSATLDGRPVPIRPAFAAFRAVALPAGKHTISFSYVPEGFQLGLAVSLASLACALGALLWPGALLALEPEHRLLDWPRFWPVWGLVAILAVVLASAVAVTPSGRVALHPRWGKGFHRFTWGAGIEAIRPERTKTRPPLPSAKVPIRGDM